MASDNSLIITVNGNATQFLKEIDKIKKETADLQKVLETTAKYSAIAFAGFAAAIAITTKSFADYETALVGVGKTTNIVGSDLQKFGKEFQKLSSTIPVSTNELLGIAQAAGQLGVTGEKNLLKFTETIAKLGVATDLAAEEGATSIARILNVTGEGIDTIDKFGSVIVALGNNFAASESEIVRMTTEVARSTAVFNVSSAEAAGLATSMRALGIQSVLGGSAVGRSFRAIQESIDKGGSSLANLSTITGIAGADLKKTFETDSTQVFQKFIEGLGKINAAGGNTTTALAAFGLQGDEILKVLPALAKNSELLGNTLRVAAEETKNATALNKEAEAAFATMNSEVQRAKNNFTNLTTNIGEKLAPAVLELLSGVNKLLESFANMNDDTLNLIASFLKWGAIITGAVTAITTAALAYLQFRKIISALAIVFKVARIAVVGFTATATGGLSLLLAFLPEIIELTSKLFGLFGKKEEPKGLVEINRQLAKMKELREGIAQAPETGFEKKDTQLARIDAEIAKLKELQQAKIKASEEFGSGELLANPTLGASPDVSLPGFPDQTIPLRAEVKQSITGGQDNSGLKKSLEEETVLNDEATAKRIETAKRQNEALKQLQKDRNDGLLAEDSINLERRAAIEEEFANARLIKNDEERQLALENLNLKHEEELAALEEQDLKKQELIIQRAEEKAALDAELEELSAEQRALFTKKELEQNQAAIDTKAEAQKKYAQSQIDTSTKVNNQFLQDEIKYGTAIATLKKTFASEEIQGFKTASNELAQLSDSRNSTLKGIGKAAARSQAAIKTAEGAISAYSALAGIPLVGPFLGAAAAAAVVAYGVEQQSRISSAATGGFVPGAQGGARDRVPALLEPGELVVPEAIAPNFIQAAGIPDTQSEQAQGGASEGGGANIFEIRLQDRAGEFISLEQREGRALGTIGSEQ